MIIQIYDYLHKHEILRWSILAVCIIIVLLLVSRLSYKEDISDLLDEPAKSKIIIKIEYYYSNKDFDLRHLLKIPARTPQDL